MEHHVTESVGYSSLDFLLKLKLFHPLLDGVLIIELLIHTGYTQVQIPVCVDTLDEPGGQFPPRRTASEQILYRVFLLFLDLLQGGVTLGFAILC